MESTPGFQLLAASPGKHHSPMSLSGVPEWMTAFWRHRNVVFCLLLSKGCLTAVDTRSSARIFVVDPYRCQRAGLPGGLDQKVASC